ncbi:gamma-glutamyltranspeptidase/glutathione hydrolase [Kribbella orskensis]|uniref:Glutathione hydrolase proenzyme n=1 Tax=Kribbella orskensis TaxID=2512216 RepID=A0ABY2BHH1_9ACTN|nr:MULTISPECIES: gamma-glutamyltransferase [Kribbella]TCN37695.1 gamma-glutamyltranspeptidase/glutathione hydrolase [Kribbella sp. VKM Ac-2500]TCO18803.1 gamma-glutamyltranspeptidase/glutathione hydrolase [Kribbella orskensis]
MRPKSFAATLTAGALVLTGLTASTATATGTALTMEAGQHAPQPAVKNPTAIGFGGAVASVDADATNIGLSVLRRGGNAVDAAVATAAALGVTEPYSAGIGGGGYFVYYNAKSRKVYTIDGRETAPATMPSNAFIDPATGKPYNFFPELVTSGVSVGIPGTLATWDSALHQWGSLSLGKALKPAADLADRGFVVDATFRSQTLDNKARFSAIVPTAKLFLPGGDAPQVGSVFKNKELANTYELLGKKGPAAFYGGPLAQEIATVVQTPPKVAGTTLPVMPGYLTTDDLAKYKVIKRDPTKVRYDGLDVYGMAPSSSGGTTVGEALNILAPKKLSTLSTPQALHTYLEASALSFADRGAYVGDPAYVNVPTKELLSPGFGAERSCLIDPAKASIKPLKAGSPDGAYAPCAAGVATQERPDTEGLSTTHLVAADKWGNVVSYTLTIEQTGGSGITVPGRGFLLNNELTDFSAVYAEADPNRIQPGKRPRSSMSPTIVLRNGKPFLALGSPGGSTIITTVLQTLTNRLDRGMTLPEAVAAPRASQRNTANVTAEPPFIDAYGTALKPYGHVLVPSGDALTSAAEIGAVAALEVLPGGGYLAAAEPKRRGGGAAGTVHQLWPR